MPTVRIAPGFVRGESLAAIPGRYSRGSLVRWQDGTLTPVGGWERITKTPLASPPRWATVYKDQDFERFAGVICDRNVYIENEGVYTDITPPDWVDADAAQGSRGYGSGTYGLANYGRDDEPRGSNPVDPNSDNNRIRTAYPVAFSAEKWGKGEFLFGHSGDGKVHVWRPKGWDDHDGDGVIDERDPQWVKDASGNYPAGPYPNLKHYTTIVCPNAPLFIQGFIVTDELHLMCLGGTFSDDGATEGNVPNRVSWSDQGNREGWNFLDVEGQAGYFDLQDAGLIYCAKKIPGAILIFTQTSVWICRYIGYPNFYGFQKLAESVAPVSPQAVVVGSNRAFWWGQGRSFWKYEGGVVAPVPCTLGLDPFEGLDIYNAPKRVTGCYNGNYPEIWWFYPSRGQNGPVVVNDRYVIYNINDGWWADGYLERSFMIASPIDNYPLGGNTAGNLFAHEQGYLDEGRTRAGYCWVEADLLSFEDGDKVYSVTQLQCDTGGAAKNVTFEFDTRINRGGPETATYSYIPRDDGYVDTRFSARDFTLRVVGQIDGPWAVGGLVFRAVARGRR